VQSQSAKVVDNESALEVASPRLYADVYDVDEVSQGIGSKPQRFDAVMQLGERLARDARPQIVQYGGRQRCHPAEHESSIG